MASSKLPASKVLEMIECEIEGLPLKETGYRADVSETACFGRGCMQWLQYSWKTYSFTARLK